MPDDITQQQTATGGDPGSSAQTVEGQGGQPDSPQTGEPTKTYTQADLNLLLARTRNEEKAKFEKQQERIAQKNEQKRLQEQGEYQKLYEAEQGNVVKLQARIAELEGTIAAKETEALKTRIGAEFKLTLTLTSRLVGETEEEIRKDAEALAREMAPPASPDLHMGNGRNGKTYNLESAKQEQKSSGRYIPA